MIVVPSGPRSSADGGFCPAGAGSGLAETQQASRSTSGMVSGHADCAATGAGSGSAQAANRMREIRATARRINERLRMQAERSWPQRRTGSTQIEARAGKVLAHEMLHGITLSAR